MLQKEIETDKQLLDYILFSSLWSGTTKDTWILMDHLYFDTPKDKVYGIDGLPVEIGVIEHWENEAEGLKEDQDGLNEFYRQFPRTEKHAFRDETKESLFNLVKIYRTNRLQRRC